MVLQTAEAFTKKKLHE